MSLILILENRDHMFRYKIKIYNKLNYKIKQKTTSVSNFVSLVNVRLYLFRDGSVFLQILKGCNTFSSLGNWWVNIKKCQKFDFV
jgi:hypothetical protein